MEKAARVTIVERRRMMMMIPTPAAEEEEEEEAGGQAAGGGALQFDEVVEILARLPVKSLARFRCVCKPWCSLTYDPIFIKKHHRMAASTTSTLFTYVGRISLYDFGGGEITDCPLPPPNEDPIRHPLSSNAVDGLVCGFRSDSVFLRNLSTGEVARLPSHTGKTTFVNVGLGFDSSTGAYKLLRVFRLAGSPGSWACEALTVSANQEWRYLGQSPPLLPFCELFYFNGFIHWINRGDAYTGTPIVVVAFDFKHETFSTMPIPESACFEPAELASFEEHLCFVGMHNSCLKILMIEDYARPVWTTLYVINCAALSCMLTDLRIIGIKNGKVLLQDGWNMEPEFTIFAYDLHNKVWSQMIYSRKNSGLRLYTEGLVSPRRLLNLHEE